MRALHPFFFILICTVLTLSCKIKHDDSIRVETFEYLRTNEKSLQLDVYSRQRNKETPLLLYVHGGGFMRGSRDRDDIVKFCKEIAENEFVVASISYSKLRNQRWDCHLPAEAKIKIIEELASEIRLALCFLSENIDKVAFDDSQIFLAGSSAGAEGVLELILGEQHKHFVQNLGIAAILNFAGGTPHVNNISLNVEVPFLLFHGSSDESIPFNCGSHQGCQAEDNGYLQICGSEALAYQLDNLGIPYRFYIGENDGHEWAYLPFQKYSSEVLRFIKEVTSGDGISQERILIKK